MVTLTQLIITCIFVWLSGYAIGKYREEWKKKPHTPVQPGTNYIGANLKQLTKKELKELKEAWENPYPHFFAHKHEYKPTQLYKLEVCECGAMRVGNTTLTPSS